MYNSSYDSALTGLLAGSVIFILILSLVVIAAGVIYIIGLWKVFKKAGKGGWEAIIPFYNTWVLVEISGLNWWWFLIAIATNIVTLIGLYSLTWIANFASIFALFNCYFNLAKRFNKSTGYAFCLTLFSFVCIPMLGFSKDSVYDGNVTVSKNGCIGSPEDSSGSANNTQNEHGNMAVNNNETVQGVPEYSFCSNCGNKMEKSTAFCPNCGNKNSL